MFGWLRQFGERKRAVAQANDLRTQVLSRLLAKYDAAQTTAENKNHWLNADNLSPAAANSLAVRARLRSRARYEVANNCYANGMTRTLAYHCVGAGVSLSIEGEDDAARETEDLFAEWSDEIDMANKLSVMRETRARDGEVFALMITNNSLRSPVKLDLRLLECDRVSTLGTQPDDRNHNDGITYDSQGNPISYDMLMDHPGDLWFAPDKKSINAEHMIHWYRCDRPGQLRGIPELTPALPLYAILRRYTLATLSAAEIAAMMSLFLKTTAPSIDPAVVDPYDEIPIQRAGMMTLPEGWNVEQLDPRQPATAYDAFTRTIIREIARCMDMPFNVAAGDSSSYNYSSGKLDHQTYFRAIDVDRRSLERNVLDRIFAAWFDEALLTPGALRQPRTRLGRPKAEWDFPPFEHVDPLKESVATSNDLSFGLTSIPTEHARRGTKWEREWSRQARALGITLQEFQTRMAEKFFASSMQAAAQAEATLNPPNQSAVGAAA